MASFVQFLPLLKGMLYLKVEMRLDMGECLAGRQDVTNLIFESSPYTTFLKLVVIFFPCTYISSVINMSLCMYLSGGWGGGHMYPWN